ncbi:PROTEIN PHOSPHATASE 2C 39-RELATED [Salix koriyanagi]|uniref:protein-serine/threonine phosphatase n=1 Tax=Salix koriyanagi TaxID=2511006 RepID=A0A9Q0PW04_9ROSI|nr:PROTEIN PHOSPHATASE 2C 39-RELATED [Salix koriyanagi]
MPDLMIMEGSDDAPVYSSELCVSFGYQCNVTGPSIPPIVPEGLDFLNSTMIRDSCLKMSSSFSCLSGAALSANATLANTNLCNGLIGEEILPHLDSPNSFRRLASSPSLSRLDFTSSSSYSSFTTLGGSTPGDNDLAENERNFWKCMSAPTRTESSTFLNTIDAQMAGGAAGEDRVQAVCSEENGWLFCGIYDGFNGRDAADFLASTLYENICLYLQMLEWHKKKQPGSFKSTLEGENVTCHNALPDDPDHSNSKMEQAKLPNSVEELTNENYSSDIISCLNRALAQAESEFMYMVEQEMEDRPDLVSVGSCVLAILLYGDHIYIQNLGDSRAILATGTIQEEGVLKAIQLTETHTVDNLSECNKVLADHPDDPSPIIYGRVKGKLKLTRAFGVGYLKKSKMNDVLMGILRVRNLCSPPYVYNHPFTMSHKVSDKDQFVVLGSDGLFDFFRNDEVVKLVHLFIQNNPSGDPAKHLVEQLVQRAADNAGFSAEDLMSIPAGRRRKYHDDVTVIVVILGNKQRTSAASASL